MKKHENIQYEDIQENVSKSKLFCECKKTHNFKTAFEFLAYQSFLTSHKMLRIL